jgi:hypothetical protein
MVFGRDAGAVATGIRRSRLRPGAALGVGALLVGLLPLPAAVAAGGGVAASSPEPVAAARSSSGTHSPTRTRVQRRVSPSLRLVRERIRIGPHRWRVVSVARVVGARPGFATTSTRLAASGATTAIGVHGATTATLPTFTWTGTAANSTTSPDVNWSDGSNWSGGVAPSPSGGPVDLVFPVLTCSDTSSAGSSTNCGLSNNDLKGLVVDQLTVDSTYGPGTTPPPSYTITGNAITLDGGLDDTLAVPSSVTSYSFTSLFFGLPITLGASQAWQVSGDIPYFGGAITAAAGTSPTLTVTLADNADVNVGSSMSLGGLSIIGADPAGTGEQCVGAFFLDGSSSTETTVSVTGPVTVTHVCFGAISSPDSLVQSPALSLSGALLVTGFSNPPTGTTDVAGPVSLDSSSDVSWELSDASGQSPPVLESDYSQLSSTSTVALGAALAQISASCNRALGTTFPLVTAAGGITGTLTDPYNGLPLPNGAIIQAFPDLSTSCGSSGNIPGPYLQITYADGGNGTAGSVTATVVAQPTSTTTVTASPAAPR